jgi:hypothetical protein
MENKSEILIYQSQSGDTKIDVRLMDETVWLNQNQLADLFQTDRSSIAKHILNIYESGELNEDATCAKFAQVQKEGAREVNRQILFYNLDMIISVGYRVQSHVATHFRMWATQRLREYIIKGFVLDDERLKQARNSYFDELLDRIRDIRSSEKVFYRKICDIYATSVDYDSDVSMTQDFFATVQNKFHYAIHGHTAAELIKLKADASKPNMGLTSWPGEKIKRQDVTTAKNYLDANELKQLNLIVNQYLEFAELQAMQRKPMYMRDWIAKLHAFLTLNDREILSNHGRISHKTAEAHAINEFEKYKKQLDATQVDELDKAMKKLQTPKEKKDKRH